MTTSSLLNPAYKDWLESKTNPYETILLLEKSEVSNVDLSDISDALEEYVRLFKAEIASPAEILTLSRAYPDEEKYSLAVIDKELDQKEPVVIGGPASVEVVDREGHIITVAAMKRAFDRFMDNFRTRNAMVLHSDVQVGWALPAYISKTGKIYKSGVTGDHLFFITELRDDTKISKKVLEQIDTGKMKSYSIAGSATSVEPSNKDGAVVMQVNDMELAEVTICEQGVNQRAKFELMKSDTDRPTSSCVDGSCLIKSQEHKHSETEIIMNSNGEIDAIASFTNWVQKADKPKKPEEEGKQAEWDIPELTPSSGASAHSEADSSISENPTPKSKEVEDQLTELSPTGRSRQEQAQAGKCTWCDQNIHQEEGGKGFRDNLSRREYNISGFCQDCQDDVFGGSEEKMEKSRAVGTLREHLGQKAWNPFKRKQPNLSDPKLRESVKTEGAEIDAQTQAQSAKRQKVSDVLRTHSSSPTEQRPMSQGMQSAMADIQARKKANASKDLKKAFGFSGREKDAKALKDFRSSYQEGGEAHTGMARLNQQAADKGVPQIAHPASVRRAATTTYNQQRSEGSNPREAARFSDNIVSRAVAGKASDALKEHLGQKGIYDDPEDRLTPQQASAKRALNRQRVDARKGDRKITPFKSESYDKYLADSRARNSEEPKGKQVLEMEKQLEDPLIVDTDVEAERGKRKAKGRDVKIKAKGVKFPLRTPAVRRNEGRGGGRKNKTASPKQITDMQKSHGQGCGCDTCGSAASWGDNHADDTARSATDRHGTPTLGHTGHGNAVAIIISHMHRKARGEYTRGFVGTGDQGRTPSKNMPTLTSTASNRLAGRLDRKDRQREGLEAMHVKRGLGTAPNEMDVATLRQRVSGKTREMPRSKNTWTATPPQKKKGSFYSPEAKAAAATDLRTTAKKNIQNMQKAVYQFIHKKEFKLHPEAQKYAEAKKKAAVATPAAPPDLSRPAGLFGRGRDAEGKKTGSFFGNLMRDALEVYRGRGDHAQTQAAAVAPQTSQIQNMVRSTQPEQMQKDVKTLRGGTNWKRQKQRIPRAKTKRYHHDWDRSQFSGAGGSQVMGYAQDQNQ